MRCIHALLNNSETHIKLRGVSNSRYCVNKERLTILDKI